MKCRHKKLLASIEPFFGPVNYKKRNKKADGNCTYVYVCTKCNCTKKVNINFNHTEQGEWNENTTII